MKISNARIYSNKVYEIIFSFKTRIKQRRQVHDYLFCEQLNLKTRTLQRAYVNEY